MLGQNPRKVPNCSSRSSLQCQIKNQGIVFSDVHDRWLVPREFIALQGFPTYPATKNPIVPEPCSFDRLRQTIPDPCGRGFLSPRNRARIVEQAGNSMPISLIALPIFWALSHTNVCRPASLQRPLATECSSSHASHPAMPPVSSETNPRIKRRLQKALSLTDAEHADDDPEHAASPKKQRTCRGRVV